MTADQQCGCSPAQRLIAPLPSVGIVIVEVEGKRYELDWREVAILLALRWVRFNALPLTRFQKVESDLGKLSTLINDLVGKGLVEKVAVGKTVIVYLTEEGLRVAKTLEDMARNAGIL